MKKTLLVLFISCVLVFVPIGPVFAGEGEEPLFVPVFPPVPPIIEMQQAVFDAVVSAGDAHSVDLYFGQRIFKAYAYRQDSKQGLCISNYYTNRDFDTISNVRDFALAELMDGPLRIVSEITVCIRDISREPNFGLGGDDFVEWFNAFDGVEFCWFVHEDRHRDKRVKQYSLKGGIWEEKRRWRTVKEKISKPEIDEFIVLYEGILFDVYTRLLDDGKIVPKK